MADIIFSEGSGLQDSIYGKSQAPIRAFIEKRAEAFEQAAVYDKIFNVQPSNQALEKFTQLTAMTGFMPVGENGSYPTDGMQEGFDKIFEHMVWKDSFAITREMIDDAKIINMRKKPQGFVTAYYRTREMFAAALFGGAMSGDNTTVNFRGKPFNIATADNLPLFSAAHTSKTQSGYLQGNIFSNAVSTDNIGLVQTHMQNVTDDDGNPLGISPDTILIPNDAATKKAVFAAIGSDKDPETANNTWNYQFGMWDIFVWPYLNKYVDSGDTPWIMLDSTYNKEYDGAVWLDRVKMEVHSTITDDNDSNVWRGYARFIAGFTDWRPFAIGGISGKTTLE